MSQFDSLIIGEVAQDTNVDYDGTTVGGYIQYRLQKPPIAGDTVREGRLELTVTSVRNRRVRLVKATVDPEEAQGDSS